MKQHLATASFVCAVIFAMAGLCIPPTGVIHSSVLMLVAQLFVLTATLLGVGAPARATITAAAQQARKYRPQKWSAASVD